MDSPGENSVDITVVIPVKNGGQYFRESLESLLIQQYSGVWEISVYDDGSTDETPNIVEEFTPKFQAKNIDVLYARGNDSHGVGYAKNKSVNASSGSFLCFCDADDVQSPTRLQEQFDAALSLMDSTGSSLVLIGTNLTRIPSNSTERYTRWANSLNSDQLRQQIYTSHGPTLLMPTWFITRQLYNRVSGFKEISKGFPEDLDFFYRAIDAGCCLYKVEKPLVVYRYHSHCASFGVSENIIWNIRVDRLKRCVLPSWDKFTIWNAGKQGKRLFKSLSSDEKQKVSAFCDVDAKKLLRSIYEVYDEHQRKVTCKFPIISVKDAIPPLIVCVKLDMTDGNFERLLTDSGWIEGSDYILFS